MPRKRNKTKEGKVFDEQGLCRLPGGTSQVRPSIKAKTVLNKFGEFFCQKKSLKKCWNWNDFDLVALAGVPNERQVKKPPLHFVSVAIPKLGMCCEVFEFTNFVPPEARARVHDSLLCTFKILVQERGYQRIWDQKHVRPGRHSVKWRWSGEWFRGRVRSAGAHFF